MKHVLPFAFIFSLIFILSCSPGEPISHNPDTAILLQGATVFDVHTGSMDGPRDLLIDGGEIISVMPAGSGKAASRAIDCSGKYVIPGLCDSHTHLAMLTTEDDEDAVQKELAEFVSQGVLYVRDVGGPVDVMKEMKRKITSGELAGPEIFYTGPMLESSPLHWEKFNEDLPGFTVPLDSEEDVDALLPVLAEKGATLIKTFNNINPDLYPHIVSVAEKHGLKIVHDPGIPLLNWVPIGMALEHGVTTFEHAFAPWSYILKADYQEQRAALCVPHAGMDQSMGFIGQMVELGIDSISEERLQELSALMVAKKAVLCPTLRAFQVGDEEEPAGEGAEEPDEQEHGRKQMMERMVTVCNHIVLGMSGNGVRLLVGHDGSEAVGAREEMVLLNAAGVSAAEVLKGATIYAAQWLEVDDRYGSLEPGKCADLVVLDADPLVDLTNVGSIHMVIQHGVIVER